jgi:hypothetical protein
MIGFIWRHSYNHTRLLTVHTLNSVWITNPSLHSSASVSKARRFISEWLLLLLPRSVVFCSSVKVEVTLRLTVGQSVSSKSWCRAPCLTVTVLFLWGALSDERTGLSFVYAVGSCQRSLSRVRVPWYSRPYFTISDLRLPFSSPPTTRRVTVEVFDPASGVGARAWSGPLTSN